MRTAVVATLFDSALSLAILKAVMIQPFFTYGSTQARSSGENTYSHLLSQPLRACASFALRTAVSKGPTRSWASTSTCCGGGALETSGPIFPQPRGQPQPPPEGRGFLMTLGSVSFVSRENASSLASASCGCVGVGTRKPKSGASVWNEARRMKCCVLVASSQTMMALSLAISTGVMTFSGRAVPQLSAARGAENSMAA